MIVRSVLAAPAWIAGAAWALVLFAAPAPADDLTLGWNTSTDPAVAGYRVYYGTASGNYTSTVDAGPSTEVTVSGLAPGTTYYFAVLDYDHSANQSAFSPEVVYTIPGEAVVFQITSQPASQTVASGVTVAFDVGAIGPGPLLYQWFANDVLLLGATNATLTVPNASAASAGNYNVVVISSIGALVSSAASLTVADIAPPSITSQPSAQTVAAGSSVTFHANVYGTPPFTFQWYHRSQSIPLATCRTLNLRAVTAADQGRYYLVVQNSAGTVMTTPVLLTVTNFFAPVTGVYNGLFYLTNNEGEPQMTVDSSGLLGNCVVANNGDYSATISIGGFNYPLTGTFSASGTDTEVVSRAVNGFSNLTVTLNLDMSGLSQSLSGSVSNMDSANSWDASLVALLATNSLPVPAETVYLIVPPLSTGVVNPPQGYGTVTVTPGGGVLVVGQLYDGSEIVQAVPLSGNGAFPFYASLYDGAGLMEGWITLAGGTPDGAVTWIRPADAVSPIPEPDVFTNTINIY